MTFENYIFTALLLVSLDAASQVTFHVKEPSGDPAKNVSVYHHSKLVAKTDENGHIKITEKILKGDSIRFEKGMKYAWYIAAKNIVNPETLSVNLLILPPSEAHKVTFGSEEDNSPVDYVVAPEPTKAYNNEIQTVEEPADYPGGKSEMFKYLAANMIYPESAIKNELQGKCFLKFVVGKDGSISDIQVVRGVPDCPECDAEAVRMIQGMPKWIPGKIGGKPVRSYYNLPINFRLN